MDHRRPGERTRGPLAASLLLHAAVLGLLAVASGSAPAPAKTKVYAVDIVSPPPNVAGEPPAAPLATQEPDPAAAQPDPAPAEPAPQPEPPAPDPVPAPPKEPAKAPEPRRTPEPPAQRPSTTTPRTNPADRPKNTERPKSAEERPKQGPTQANRPAGGPGTQSGTGSGPNRTQGGGTQTGAATGRNPDASSPGGEGLNIHVEGDPCPVAGYCENVTRQVNRFFRPPPGTAGATGEVCFRIQRDGRVTDIQTRGVRGGAAFRLAMMEAAEAAGSRRAFGTLPAAFDPGRWRWCVELSPS